MAHRSHNWLTPQSALPASRFVSSWSALAARDGASSDPAVRRYQIGWRRPVAMSRCRAPSAAEAAALGQPVLLTAAESDLIGGVSTACPLSVPAA